MVTNWFVYILKCRDLTYYIGISNNVKKRIEIHNSGKGAKYTRSRLPVVLLFQEKYSNKSEATKRELQLKKLSRKQKDLLIAGNLTL